LDAACSLARLNTAAGAGRAFPPPAMGQIAGIIDCSGPFILSLMNSATFDLITDMFPKDYFFVNKT